MSIQNEIKRIRKDLLLTQEEFAQAIGVSFTTVNRWENGKAMPSLKNLKAIKQFCILNSEPFISFDNIFGEE